MTRAWIDTSKPCPGCGMAYDAFRGRLGYRDAYHEIAWTREHVGHAAIMRHLASDKRDLWSAHVESCGLDAPEISDVATDDLIDAPRLSFAVDALEAIAPGPGDCPDCDGWGVIDGTEIGLCAACGGHGSMRWTRATLCDASRTMIGAPAAGKLRRARRVG